MSDNLWADGISDVICESLSNMTAILAEIGDDDINTTPALRGANSPYAIAFHTVAMLEFWLGSVVGGEKIPRDRSTEFQQTGTLTEATGRLVDVRERVAAWTYIAANEGVRDRDVEGTTQKHMLKEASPQWMLAHTIRDLCQHIGQLEITRDILASER